MTCTLIISTYNRPDALRLCLLSAISQSCPPAEIIIGDDGSKQKTEELIAEIKAISPVPIVHVWQEDKGFRLAKMRNKCVAVSNGDYIIECDGDIILHQHFVRDHMMIATPGHYLKGGRTNLGKTLSAKLCAAGKKASICFFTHGIEAKRENSIHLPYIARLIAPYYRKNKESALGCNMSFFKNDFLALNGYDEYYEGWGGEDGDFGRRMQRHGLKKLHLKFAGIVYHLWHEDKFMYNKDRNCQYSRRPDDQQPIRCIDGVDKYFGPNAEPIIIR